MSTVNHFIQATLRWLKNHGFVVLAGLLTLTPFLFVWLQGHLFYDFDMTFITAPIEDLFARYQRRGELPLWAPEIQGGYPLLAISHLGFFYPLHAALRMFLPGVLTLNISLAFHALLAAGGMYALLRQERLTPSAAAIGSLAFTGTGFLVGHLYLTNVLLPLSWIPLNLWLLGSWLKTGRALALGGLSVAVALQILLGQPQAALIGVVMLALFSLSHLAFAPRRTVWRLFPLVPAAALSLVLAYAQIRPTLDIVPYSDRADALLANELYEFSFPLYHVVSWVFPHAFGYRESYIGGKNETELASWFGVSVLLLAAGGLLTPTRSRGRLRLFGVLLMGVALLLASGEHSPLYRYLVEHQWVTSLAIPARWMLLFVVAVALFAAHGSEMLFSAARKEKRSIILLAAALVTLLFAAGFLSIPGHIAEQVRQNIVGDPWRFLIPLVAGAVTAAVIMWGTHRAPTLLLLIIGAELFVPNVTRNVHVPFAQAFHRAQAETILSRAEPAERLFTQRDLSVVPPERVTFSPLKRLTQQLSVQQAFQSLADDIHGVELELRWGKEQPRAGTVHLRVRDLDTNEERTGTVSSLEAGDGRWLAARFPPFRRVQGHRFLVTITNTHTTPGPWILATRYASLRGDFLPGGTAETCEHGSCRRPKIADMPEGQTDIVLRPVYPAMDRIQLSQELLSPHIAAAKGFFSVQWLGALQLKEVKRYLYAIGDQNENADGVNPFLRERRDMVDRFGIRYLLGSTSPDRDLGDLPAVEKIQDHLWESQRVRLYRNLQSYPRAQFASRIVSVTHPDEALGVLTARETPRDLIAVEDDRQVRDLALSVGEVTVTSSSPTEVVLRTRNTGTGLLVLRDTFFPYWEADVDGTPTRIYLADMIFRSVLVPAGEHTVRFSYAPRDTLRAVRISAAAWAVTVASLSVYGWLLLRRQRKKTLVREKGQR